MHLYLARHGQALSKYEDPHRPLSNQGLVDIRKMAAFLARPKATEISWILHSGKLRAEQTTAILAEHLPPSGGVGVSDGLAPMDDPAVWSDRLAVQKENLMLVGHLPHLERLTALLLAGTADQSIVRFKAGGVVCLERNEGGDWSLRWMVAPEMLTE
ncbi:phosphohistidine phosphatase SixA [Candidatus Neomarinimicrobiota bacterium]